MPVEQQIQAVLWGLGVGLAFATIVYLVVSNAWYRMATGDRIPDTDTKPAPIGMVEEYPEGLAEAHGGPTVFLRLLILGYAVWLVGYVALWFQHRWI